MTRLTCVAAATVMFVAQPCVRAQTSASTDYKPLTRAGRVDDYVKKMFSPVSVVSSAASAGIGQWRDKPEEWGQGGAGFGRRFASSYAQHMVIETLMFGASSILHEDNRYVRSSGLGTKGRILHAIRGTLFTRLDDGSPRFAFSRIGSYAGAAAISRAWQPPDSHKLRGFGTSLSTSIGMSMGMNVVREFWPRKR